MKGESGVVLVWGSYEGNVVLLLWKTGVLIDLNIQKLLGLHFFRIL